MSIDPMGMDPRLVKKLDDAFREIAIQIDFNAQVRDLEMSMIYTALRCCSGVSSSARFLNLKRTTLVMKMKKYGIKFSPSKIAEK